MGKWINPRILFEILESFENHFIGIRKLEKADLIVFVIEVAMQDFQTVLIAEHSVRMDVFTFLDLKLIIK